MATKNNGIVLKTYKKTIIPQSATCGVTIYQKNKEKFCRFFMVSRNGQALLGMPDTETLEVLTIKCNTTDMKHKMSILTMK